MDDGAPSTARILAVAGLTWGLTLLLGAGRVVDALCPELPEGKRWLVRVLGARLVAQHATVLVAPVRPVLPVAAAVEGLHGLSMVPLLGLPRYRRAALISGGIAGLSAVVLAAASAEPSRRPASERR
ncbi:hypothetical protein [Geodermatophilus sp. CPCC 206100]|uniref:hypothetical protein n=1 Tax=Geodermatophilus sp. CPCC 206100 TaxID=3020054 RepID=UPI003B007717